MDVKNEPTLNRGQQEAADAFFEFLFSDETEMGISGGGGYGKSFLMSYLIDKIIPRYHAKCTVRGIKPKYRSIAMTSTTNKSATVLAEATGRPTGTIHSFLGLRVQEDFKTGRSRLIKTPAWCVHEDLVLIVDEASMVDSPLDQNLQEGTHNCKIVYVSDKDQLAPVTETLSPIYRPGRMKTYHLTEPMRNAGQPALMAVSQQLRETVQTGIFKPIKVIPGVIDWVDDLGMEQALNDKFMLQTRDSRVLAYTNERVIAYNEHIRAMRALPYEYQVGEILVNNQSIMFNKAQSFSVEEEVTVTKLDPEIDQLNFGDVTIDVQYATLHSEVTGSVTNVPLATNRQHYLDCMKWLAKNKNWTALFSLKARIPDLRQRDAATVHKAQGSTYKTTFIDVGNLSTCHRPDLAARLLYVAFTRASERIVLYGDLATKYGGLIT